MDLKQKLKDKNIKNLELSFHEERTTFLSCAHIEVTAGTAQT